MNVPQKAYFRISPSFLSNSSIVHSGKPFTEYVKSATALSLFTGEISRLCRHSDKRAYMYLPLGEGLVTVSYCVCARIVHCRTVVTEVRGRRLKLLVYNLSLGYTATELQQKCDLDVGKSIILIVLKHGDPIKNSAGPQSQGLEVEAPKAGSSAVGHNFRPAQLATAV